MIADNSTPHVLGVQHCDRVNACLLTVDLCDDPDSLSVASQLCVGRLFSSYLYVCTFDISFLSLCGFFLLMSFFHYYTVLFDQKVGLSAGGGGVMGLCSRIMGSSSLHYWEYL